MGWKFMARGWNLWAEAQQLNRAAVSLTRRLYALVSSTYIKCIQEELPKKQKEPADLPPVLERQVFH
jgi:hypothetical protein